jgi:hypothetical protein
MIIYEGFSQKKAVSILKIIKAKIDIDHFHR